MRSSFLWITALVASAGLAAQPASAAAAARTWDLVTYTAPEGFKVVERKEEGGGRVELTKASATSHCIVYIYSSTPTSSDLEANFAVVWGVLLKTVDAPEPTTRNVGNTRAAVGQHDLDRGGQPWRATVIVLDAGASVLPMIVVTSTPPPRTSSRPTRRRSRVC